MDWRQLNNPFAGLPQGADLPLEKRDEWGRVLPGYEYPGVEDVGQMTVERGFTLPFEEMRQSEYMLDLGSAGPMSTTRIPHRGRNPPMTPEYREYLRRAANPDAMAIAAGILDVDKPIPLPQYERRREPLIRKIVPEK